MELGDCPAAALRAALEDRLDILVLDVDAPPGLASAAVRARGLKCILVNRQEPEGHRNYGMAHGLFRLLTWDAIPPDRLEPLRVPRRGNGWLVARLAESFATALLMPWSVVQRHLGLGPEPEGIVSALEPAGIEKPLEPAGIVTPGEPRRMSREEWARVKRSGDLHARLVEGAEELRVSVGTYVRRLRRLYLLSREEVDGFDDQYVVAGDPALREGGEIPAFSADFVRRVADALEAGRLSAKRAASVLDLPLPALALLLRSYGHEAYFEA